MELFLGGGKMERREGGGNLSMRAPGAMAESQRG